MLALMLAAVITTVSLPDFSRDTRITGFMSDVLRRGLTWGDFSETAAFLVRDTAGDVQCLLWPETNEYKKQSFPGALPARTVAVVHTHPENLPNPSKGDIEQAQRLGIPLFVLTRQRVTAVDPDGNVIPIVARSMWASERPAQKCEDQWLAR
jgi:hypothetical protein